MTPKYFDGDVVFCSDDAPHVDGMPAAVRLSDGSASLKFIDAVDDEMVALRPANDRYPTKRVRREDIVRIHRVVGSYRPEIVE